MPEAVRGEAGPDGAADHSLSGRTHAIEGTEPPPDLAIELIATPTGIPFGEKGVELSATERIILVSNRGPVQYGRENGERTTARGAGGLVTAL